MISAFKRWFAYRYYRKVTGHRPPMSRREFARLMAGLGDVSAPSASEPKDLP